MPGRGCRVSGAKKKGGGGSWLQFNQGGSHEEGDIGAKTGRRGGRAETDAAPWEKKVPTPTPRPQDLHELVLSHPGALFHVSPSELRELRLS